jgi:hypothetical protein
VAFTHLLSTLITRSPKVLEISFATGGLNSAMRAVLFAGFVAACAGTRPEPGPFARAQAPAEASTSSRPAASATAGAPSPVAAGAVVTFEGMCDASGAVELDERRFVAADDEDNLLRIYDAERGGPPLQVIDLRGGLELQGKNAEADLEACTRVGDVAYFLGSHARTSKGKHDANRLLFFAMSLPGEGSQAAVVGRPCYSLLDVLLGHAALKPFALDTAAALGPKQPGGLNIEGLTALPDGSLLVGFRNPVPEGRALLVRMLNPAEVTKGTKAELSAPHRLDLAGLGVRALSLWRSRVLLIAGPPGDGGPFFLYKLNDALEIATKSEIDFTGYGPEGIFSPDGSDRVLVLSDDGMQPIAGKPCKKAKLDSMKRFRGLWVEPPR